MSIARQSTAIFSRFTPSTYRQILPARQYVPSASRTFSMSATQGQAAQHTYGDPTPAGPDGNSVGAAAVQGDAAKGKVHMTNHTQYHSPRILPESLQPNPLSLFKEWFQSALNPADTSIPKVNEPEAMNVATCTKQGIPSSRFVLLKTVDDTGFVFFTNYNSRKSQELLDNPYASLAFYWREVSRQVRVVGRVEKVSRQESEDYFMSRPKGSRLGAWVSEQSSAIQEDTLENRMKSLELDYADKEVECPEHWGGWRIVPFEVEFWAGQPSRLHDRFRYLRPQDSTDESQWEVSRLAP